MTPRGARTARTRREIERGRAMVERSNHHDLIEKWRGARLVAVKEFTGGVRVVVGDTYIDDPDKSYPSERLIATIALLLQAQGLTLESRRPVEIHDMLIRLPHTILKPHYL